MKVRNQQPAEKVEVPMTPMIDVVFQLLVFFIMSFKIVAPEGDFNVKLPLSSHPSSAPPVELLPPLKVALAADASGNLAGIQLNGAPVESMADLHGQVLRLVTHAGAQREDFECELQADANLHYDHMVQALTAVSGQRSATGDIHRLIEQIKFVPTPE